MNPHTELFIEAAKRLGIDYEIINYPNLARFTKGDRQTIIYRTQIETNTLIPSLLCLSKFHTSFFLRKDRLPVPKQKFCQSIKDALDASKTIGFPLVVKPIKGLGGKFITTNIRNPKELKSACKQVLTLFGCFVVEKYHQGEEYRFLVLNGKVLGVVKRTPPTITGDGRRTVHELLKEQPKVPIDAELRRTLKDQGITQKSILKKGRKIAVRQNSNVTTGGKAIAIENSTLHPQLLDLAIAAARTMQMSLVGVDMLIRNPRKPATSNAVILELNSQPGIDIHERPDRGTPQPVAEEILNFLFNQETTPDKTPYGMYSAARISKKDINVISMSWSRHLNEND